MNDDTILGGALNQLGQTVKQAAKQVVKLPEEMGRDAGEQIGGSAQLRQGSEEQAKQNASSESKGWQSDEERIRFLKDLYGSAQPSPGATAGKAEQNLLKEPAPSTFAKASAAKPEEQKALMELRNQLHKENYYDPTFNPPKKQEEERPAEKVEMEKKQEMQELEQKEAKKPPPLAVQRERNKAEMFRGAAG